MLAMGDMPLGRAHWPIYAAAVRHGLPIGVHAGSSYHNPNDADWLVVILYRGLRQPGARLPDPARQPDLRKGKLTKFPGSARRADRSGFTWLPACIWRLTKFWRGLRTEVTLGQQLAAEIVRQHVRLTLQPIDAPPNAAQFERLWEHMDLDEMLLFSTDYPHAQFDGDAVLATGPVDRGAAQARRSTIRWPPTPA